MLLYYKIFLYFIGSFPFNSIISNIVYYVNLLAEYWRAHTIFYTSYFCPYVGPAAPYPLAPLPFNDISTRKYKVKDILDSRLDQSSTKYLIKWASYHVF